MVLSVAFFGAAEAPAVVTDGEVLTTVALAARRGRDDEGVPGTEGAIGASVDVAAGVPPDVRGPVGRDAAGVLGAEGTVGCVEFSLRPASSHRSVSESNR
jgi:hypothetical protein